MGIEKRGNAYIEPKTILHETIYKIKLNSIESFPNKKNISISEPQTAKRIHAEKVFKILDLFRICFQIKYQINLLPSNHSP